MRYINLRAYTSSRNQHAKKAAGHREYHSPFSVAATREHESVPGGHINMSPAKSQQTLNSHAGDASAAPYPQRVVPTDDHQR